MTWQTRRGLPKAVVWHMVLLIAALALLAFALKVAGLAASAQRDASLLAGLSVGMTESDVVGFLGQPDARITGESGWQNEPWLSFRAPQTPIEDHVLAYHLSGRRAIYAYVDSREVVTCVYWPEVCDGP